ncbi:MAG TPA: ATP-binding cassette domain-containing protein, partial [Thermoanaerobaculia bacterium]
MALSKQFTSRALFENLSFTIHEGDHIGLVGPNGSGKSTLLKILAGIEEPDSGTRAMRKRLRIGYVPQDPVFAPGKSVEGVLEEALGDPHDSALVGRVLGKAGFTDPASATETLSGGWRKRL